MVERGGSVEAHVVPRKMQGAIMAHVEVTVDRDAIHYTDDARVYDRLAKDGREHQRINHSAKVYVSGDIHTNTIEGFWSMVKTGILGTHHHVSAKWLQGYLNEYAWRYNCRGVDDDGNRRLMFLELILRAALVSR